MAPLWKVCCLEEPIRGGELICKDAPYTAIQVLNESWSRKLVVVVVMVGVAALWKQKSFCKRQALHYKPKY